MISPSIFKLAQQTQSPGITALQTGMHNFIWDTRKLLQETSEDVTGLYNYFKTYIQNLDKTYPKADHVTGMIDQTTIDHFMVLRDKVIKRLATRNLAEDIKQHSDQDWYKTIAYYGEQVMGIFQPVSQLIANVKEDQASLEQQGAVIGQALTQAGDQLLQLTRKFQRAHDESKEKQPITASKIPDRFKKLSVINSKLSSQ